MMSLTDTHNSNTDMDMDMLALNSLEPLTSSTASFPREWWKDDSAFEERHFRLPLDSEEHWQVSFRAPATLC